MKAYINHADWDVNESYWTMDLTIDILEELMAKYKRSVIVSIEKEYRGPDKKMVECDPYFHVMIYDDYIE